MRLFGLPTCDCKRTVPYRKLVARLPKFSVQCKCGKTLHLRAGWRCVGLWGVTLLLCFLLNRWMLDRVSEPLPMLLYTLLLICAAFFLSPLVWHKEK